MRNIRKRIRTMNKNNIIRTRIITIDDKNYKNKNKNKNNNIR